MKICTILLSFGGYDVSPTYTTVYFKRYFQEVLWLFLCFLELFLALYTYIISKKRYIWCNFGLEIDFWLKFLLLNVIYKSISLKTWLNTSHYYNYTIKESQDSRKVLSSFLSSFFWSSSSYVVIPNQNKKKVLFSVKWNCWFYSMISCMPRFPFSRIKNNLQLSANLKKPERRVPNFQSNWIHFIQCAKLCTKCGKFPTDGTIIHFPEA